MSNLKTIKVNPIFLGTNNSGQPKNKTRKEKPTTLGSTNNVKKKLIARIKNFQQTTTPNNNSINNINNNNNKVQEDEFNASVNFLNDLSRDKIEKKHFKHNTTLKKKQPIDKEAYMQIATELPPELNWNTFKIQPAAPAPVKMSFPMQPPLQIAMQPPQIAMQPPQIAPLQIAMQPPQIAPLQIAMQPPQIAMQPIWQPPPAPLYGNLKNGQKPTFRTWQRTTQKNRPVVASKPVINILEDVVVDIKENTGNEEKKVIVEEQVPAPLQMPPAMPVPVLVPVPAPAKPQRKRITRTLKYKLGKHANGKVSVLIKNAQTRRKVQTETALLKQKSILDVKNYLRSNNLLKVGSEAPNDVLRQMYEQSILAGAIENKANDVLLHNYFNDEKK